MKTRISNIAELIKKGDDAFSKGDRWKAEEFYTKARELRKHETSNSMGTIDGDGDSEVS